MNQFPSREEVQALRERYPPGTLIQLTADTRGITTIGGIANCDPKVLKSWLGVHGLKLWEFANGVDRTRVAPDGYVAPSNR